MIRFRDITIGDKEEILSYTLESDRRNCDLSFANLISWRFLYNTQFAILDHHLVLRFYAGRHLAYMMPIPEPGFLGGYFSVIKAIMDDSTAMGHPLLMLGVSREKAEILDTLFPETFRIEPDRDRADYIYSRERLVSLSGKKLQAKRNHANKFRLLYPEYEYRELTKEMVPQCLELERKWRRNAMKEDKGGLSVELRSMTRAFNRWESLGLIGGTIWVGDRLVAFTFGNPINKTTFDVCVEKADIGYEGIYAVINQEFARHIPENFIYINREEDLGDEGLRRSKLSYRPEMLLEKFCVMERHPLSCFEDQNRIKEEAIRLWRTAFPEDSESFVALYFNKVYSSANNICVQIDRHVVAGLQALPYKMLYKNKEVPIAYISGVATLPNFRRQGIGGNLMMQAHFRLFCGHFLFSVLIPAEPWIASWYESLGYVWAIKCMIPPSDMATLSFGDFDKRQRAKPCVVLQSERNFEIAKEDYFGNPEYYKSKTNDIPAMIRIIDAKEALSLYASANPDASFSLRIEGDSHIPSNNSYYTVNQGLAIQTDEPCVDAKRLSVSQLASLIFEGMDSQMTLMLN